jgi:hypothetical protein
VTSKIQVAGLPAEIRKIATYVNDRSSSQFLHAVMDTYDYEMTVWGDAGAEIDYAFDGRQIRWHRVRNAGGVCEYVADSLTSP